MPCQEAEASLIPARLSATALPTLTDVWNFFLKTEVPKDCLPIGAIPTIAASGSEMSGSCVITNEDGWLKRGSTRSDLCRPKFALLNPRLTYTLPQYQTESGCVDILMHTMERYFVNLETMEITDSISESLMQTVIYNARILMKEPGNYNARAEVMWPEVPGGAYRLRNRWRRLGLPSA